MDNVVEVGGDLRRAGLTDKAGEIGIFAQLPTEHERVPADNVIEIGDGFRRAVLTDKAGEIGISAQLPTGHECVPADNVVEIGGDLRRAAREGRMIWVCCLSCGHAHRFTPEESMRDTGGTSFAGLARRAVCILCGAHDAMVGMSKKTRSAARGEIIER